MIQRKTIGHVTDLHLGEDYPKSLGVDSVSNWNRILEDIRSRQIEELVFGGDIGTNDDLPWFFDSLGNLQSGLDLVLGNHDYYSAVEDFLPTQGSVPGKHCYTFYDNAFQYYFLDTSSEVIEADQLDWMTRVSKANLPVILFIHHPVLPIPTPIDQKHPLLEREKLHRLLLDMERPVTIFCGHYHMDDDRTDTNIRQIVTPAASYQVEKEVEEIATHGQWFGYRLITIEESISTEVVTFHKR